MKPKTGKVRGKDIIKKLWSLTIGAGSTVFKADISGIWLGAIKWASAPFRVDMEGNLTASSITVTGGSITGISLDADLWDGEHLPALDSGKYMTNNGADLSWGTPPNHNIRTYTWVISIPGIGGIPGSRLAEVHTVTRIDSYVTSGTSATFNIEERSTIGSAGVDILTSDQVADIDGASDTSFANASLASGNWLWLDISATDGSPGQLVVTLTATL